MRAGGHDKVGPRVGPRADRLRTRRASGRAERSGGTVGMMGGAICPYCDVPAVAVLRVTPIGTRTDLVEHGTVHKVADRDPHVWRLYVHGGDEGGE